MIQIEIPRALKSFKFQMKTVEPTCSQLSVLVSTESARRVWEQKTLIASRVLMAHTCNPSYSRSTDEEDGGSKPASGK
jgi:hypothetical protein